MKKMYNTAKIIRKILLFAKLKKSFYFNFIII